MGAAIQNLLLGAHALGYGSSLTSVQEMASPRLHALCGLVAGEVPVCCVNICTVTRVRPLPAVFVSEFGAESAHGSV